MELRGIVFKKILVQRADRLGDVVFTLPVLQWLKTRFPDAEIHFVTTQIPGDFLKTQSVVDQVHVVSSKVGISELLRLSTALRSEKFELYISLWNDPSMAWLGALARIPCRIGDSTNRSIAWLYTHTIRQQWENLLGHQIDFNMQLLLPLGWRAAVGWQWHLDVDAPALERVQTEIQEQNELGLPVVTFFCGTGGSNIPISDSVVLESIDVLSDTYCVVLIGHVSPQSELVSEEPSGGINRLNQTTIAELVAWISVSDVVVGADTGPIHIAAALNRAIVFCPVRKSNLPTRFGPWTDRLEILRRDYLCTHIPPDTCPDPDCLALPDSPRIVAAVERLISRTEPLSKGAVASLFLKSSVRILVVVPSNIHGHAMVRLAKRWKPEGIIIIPIVRSRIDAWEMASLCLKYNSVVIVAPHISWWKGHLIRLIIGVRFQYLPPVIARVRVSVSEDSAVFLGWVSDWLSRKKGVI